MILTHYTYQYISIRIHYTVYAVIHTALHAYTWRYIVPKLTAMKVPVLPIPALQWVNTGASLNTALKHRTNSTKSKNGPVSSGTPKSGHE